MSYSLRVSPTEAGNSSKIIRTEFTYYKVEGLDPGTEYSFKIFSFGEATHQHDGMNPAHSEVVTRQTGLFVEFIFQKTNFPLTFLKTFKTSK